MTSNQYYGGLNRRFDNRAKLLRRLGFSYAQIDDLGFAVFTRKRRYKVANIPAVVLHAADRRLWHDTLRSALIQ